MIEILSKLSKSRARGIPLGIYSVCSAHPVVIKAAVQQALADESYLLIEATCNQVNQMGGYTGMTPVQFAQGVKAIAKAEGLPLSRLILGGDHLGPNPWQHFPAEIAMAHARDMVAAYARAGFTKIHLDTSMGCVGDPMPLPEELVAERAAQLCAVAEASGATSDLCYVIGTEVPIPGGATESLSALEVTPPHNVQRTLAIHREAFWRAGLEAAWSRVIAIVVQPGVEFNHETVVDYHPDATLGLQQVLDAEKGLVYEAHSTDYQRPAAYAELVRDGFAILKVGPALTFALREGLYALAAIEDELVPAGSRSGLVQTLETAMLTHREHWEKHYHGDAASQRLLREFSYSDRIRYYWSDPEVQHAVETLLSNLDQRVIPEPMLSQYLPAQYAAVRSRGLKPIAENLLLHKVREALEPYSRGCRAAVKFVPAEVI